MAEEHRTKSASEIHLHKYKSLKKLVWCCKSLNYSNFALPLSSKHFSSRLQGGPVLHVVGAHLAAVVARARDVRDGHSRADPQCADVAREAVPDSRHRWHTKKARRPPTSCGLLQLKSTRLLP